MGLSLGMRLEQRGHASEAVEDGRVAMRHRVAHRKLGRVTEHRIAMLRNQASALIEHERIQTTVREGEGAAPVRRAHHLGRQAQPRRAGGQRACA